MPPTIKKNECLIKAGMTNLRAPDGSPLQNVPTYKVVDKRDASLELVEPLSADECLVLQGQEVFRDDDGNFLTPTPLYRKVKKTDINPRTKLTKSEQANCDALVVGTMVEIFGQCMKQAKALG